MKLLHLADLHIGKRVNDFSMIDDQRYVMEQVYEMIKNEDTEGVILAGDVYDKSIPSAEAVKLLDEILAKFIDLGQDVFMISGNHDSAERLAFGAGILSKSKLYISPVYDGQVHAIDISNEVRIHLLPFIKPQMVRPHFPGEEIKDYTDAVKLALSECNTQAKHNILVAHQFVTGASTSDSEELSVGGLDNVSADVFKEFEYVALGHMHGPQRVSRDSVRYAGSPLKYSFSEAKHKKSVTLLEIEEDIQIRTIELVPRYDMKIIKGRLEDIMQSKCQDYVKVVLTDKEEGINVLSTLRVNYPNIMALSYDNLRTQTNSQVGITTSVEDKTPLELFGELYEKQNGEPLDVKQTEYLEIIVEEMWGDN